MGSLKTRFSICLKVNISRSSSAGVTGKQICRSTIAAGSYILVGYELLNNDFRHVKSLFHFVLPPIKSLRVSPERKALAAWSRSNINIFYVTLYKKLQFRQSTSKKIIAQNACLSIVFHNIFLQINLNFSTGFYSFRCNFLFLAIFWSGRTGLPGFPSFRPVRPCGRAAQAPPRPLPQVPYFSNFFPCKDCLFMLLFFIIEADFFCIGRCSHGRYSLPHTAQFR